MRVIISTQGENPKLAVILIRTCALEPTVVPPVLLDLCSIVFLHRFSSPAWWEHIVKHVPADFTGSDAFDKVVRLPVLVLSDVFSFLTIKLVRPDKRWFLHHQRWVCSPTLILTAPALCLRRFLLNLGADA